MVERDLVDLKQGEIPKNQIPKKKHEILNPKFEERKIPKGQIPDSKTESCIPNI